MAENLSLSFDELRRQMDLEIKKLSHSKRILYWMGPDEIYSWMLYELWIAHQTYNTGIGDNNLNIKKYWWRLWINRRSKLAKHYYANKEEINRSIEETVVMQEIKSKEYYRSVPACPVGGLLESCVWNLLAYDFDGVAICNVLSMNRSVYMDIMKKFRVPSVGRYLEGM